MNVALDEYGNPFLVLREQETTKRLQGIEAQKSNILAARAVADILRTSLGPKGMDKIIVGPDGNVTVTNDGATILSQMEIEHQCAKLLVDLSKSQDEESGDGTTGVVVFAGSLLEQAYRLLEKGLHPLHIADGFETACSIALEKMEKIATPIDINQKGRQHLIEAVTTALGSKVVSSRKLQLAEIAVEAVLAVADLDRKDVNFDLIKIDGKPGGRLEETCVVSGIVLDKDLSHSQMRKVTRDARIAILTCPFEPPKPKTKHKLDIQSVEDYKKLQKAEQKYFTDMVDKVEESGANFVICQWGFDDEANHLLMQRGIPAVRWVGGVELELIAIATGGTIVPRFEELSPKHLGTAGIIRETSFGTEGNPMIIIEDCVSSKTVTILVRGGNSMAVAEGERCMHDAICCIRNLIRSPRIVPGGGATEIALSLAVEAAANNDSSIQQYAINGFAEALLSLAQALSENSGMDPINTVSEVKSRQFSENNPNIGIDCINGKSEDMMSIGVYESYSCKKNQLALATQVVKMILKIDDIITPDSV